MASKTQSFVAGRKACVPAILLCALIVISLFFQGGFGDWPTALCGIFAIAAFAVRLLRGRVDEASFQSLRPAAVPLLFTGVALLYLISAGVSGITLTSLAETGSWLGAAGVAWLAFSLKASERTALKRYLCWIGVVCGALGILMFIGLLPLTGAVANGRLQFTLTYANAAGAWFSAAAFMCLLSGDKLLQRLSAVPFIALLLTMSAGAIGVTYLALLVLLVLNWRKKKGRDSLISLGALLAVGVVVCVVGLTTGRLQDAGYDFVERFVQMSDGFAVLLAAPMLGVGPDNWQYVYPMFQSAQYRATVIHCGYLQVAVDAGFLAVAFLIAAIAVGLRNLLRVGDKTSLVPVAVIACHSLIDFDLQFGCLLLLMAALLSRGQAASPDDELKMPSRVRLIAIPLCVIALIANCMCFAAGIEKTAITLASDDNDADAAISLCQGSGWAERDPRANTILVESYNLKRSANNAFAASNSNLQPWYDRAVIARATALYGLKQSDQAATLLIEALERCPYDAGLFQSAAQMFTDYGLSGSLQGRYKDAIAKANALVDTGNARFLRNQYYFEAYRTKLA